MQILKDLNIKKDLSYEYYPSLVYFKDLHNLTSVEKVNPLKLNETFGSGVHLLRINLETTTDPVTYGNVIKYLPWIKNNNQFVDSIPLNQRSWRRVSDAPFYASLSYSSFLQGM